MRNTVSYLILWLLVSLTACQEEVVSLGEDTDKVALTFDLYQANLTKAEEVSVTSNLKAGALFKVYAFKVEEGVTVDMSTAKAEAEGTYKIAANGSASAVEGQTMYLYRGVYNLYFVSYNEANAPEVISGNLVNVKNEQDFMYTMQNVTVQPGKPGEKTMSVTLVNPFVRLCSQVTMTVKGDKVNSPATISGLVVKSITMSYLSPPRNYQLGAIDWQTPSTGGDAREAVLFNTFSSNGGNIDPIIPRGSIPMIVLPLAGSALEFTIILNIQYYSNGELVWKEFPFKATARKTFLPGMMYKFEFTLVFFGDFKETDLTLGILEYTKITNTTDPVGQD